MEMCSDAPGLIDVPALKHAQHIGLSMFSHRLEALFISSAYTPFAVVCNTLSPPQCSGGRLGVETAVFRSQPGYWTTRCMLG
jgi:hypothetical protein